MEWTPRKLFNNQKRSFSYCFVHSKISRRCFQQKNFFFVLITKVQKKFFKKMLKTLFQNKYLQDDRLFCQSLILKLNLSKEIQILSLIFFRLSFYRKNEQLSMCFCVQGFRVFLSLANKGLIVVLRLG